MGCYDLLSAVGDGVVTFLADAAPPLGLCVPTLGDEFCATRIDDLGDGGVTYQLQQR